MSALAHTEAYLQEGRDAHGRWIKGFSELSDLVQGMVKSGDIDNSTGKKIVANMKRHTDLKRGMAPNLSHAQQLEYLAQTLRHDSLMYRQQKPPDIKESKNLSGAAYAVETAHAAALKTPKGKSLKGVDAHILTPESHNLDGPGGAPISTPSGPTPSNVLNLNPKLKAAAEKTPEPVVKTPAAEPKVSAPATPPVVKAVEPLHVSPAGDVLVEDVKVGHVIQTPTGARTVKSIRLWPDGRRTLVWKDGEGKKGTTYGPGVKVSHADGSAPAHVEPIVKIHAESPPVKTPAAKVAKTPNVPKAPKTLSGEPEPKTKFSVSKPVVVATALNMQAQLVQVGDIMEMGTVRIPTGEYTTKYVKKHGHLYPKTTEGYKSVKVRRRVLSVEPVPDSAGQKVEFNLSEPLNTKGDGPHPQLTDHTKTFFMQTVKGKFGNTGGGDVAPGTMAGKLGVKTLVDVIRPVAGKGSSGSKVKLHEHPTAAQYHRELSAALENGDDLSPFDPARRPLAAGQDVGHVQQLLYDMAVGQRSGKIVSGNVVTHDEYLQRLRDNGELDKINSEAERLTPYKFGNVYGFSEPEDLTLPGNASDDELARMYAATEGVLYSSAARSARNEWQDQQRADYATTHPGGGDMPTPKLKDYAKSLTPEQVAAFAPDRAPTQNSYDRGTGASKLKAEREKILVGVKQDVADKRIDMLRKEENTAERDFHIPQFGDASLEPQSWASLQAEIDKQSKPQSTGVASISGVDFHGAIVKALAGLDPYTGSHPGTGAPETSGGWRWRHSTIATEIDNRIDKKGNSVVAAVGELTNSWTSDTAHQSLAGEKRAELAKAVKSIADGATQTGTYQTKDYTPSFYTAGVLDDGVLYHQNTTRAVDPAKLGKALAIMLETHGYTPEAAKFAAKSHIVGTELDENGGIDLNNVISSINSPSQMYDDKMKGDLTGVVERTRAALSGSGISETTGHIAPGPGNVAMMKVMKGLDAQAMADDRSPAAVRMAMKDSPSGSWGELVHGTKLVVQDGGREMTSDEQLTYFHKFFDAYRIPAVTGSNPVTDAIHEAKTAFDMAANIQQYEMAIDDMAKAISGHEDKLPKMNAYVVRAKRILSDAKLLRVDAPGSPVKRLEYVPQTQSPESKTGPWSGKGSKISRNQKGRLSLIGYTPEEAHAKLKELGLIGELEPHVPSDSVFRGPRRSGQVVPLHPAYVRGDAPVPHKKDLLFHGLTGGGIGAFESIAQSGGLMSIEERYRRWIKVQSTSQVGDVGSGMDHTVSAHANNGGVGAGASGINLIMKPDTLLRRDILVSPRDFGGGGDRYSKYKNYRDEMEAKAGLAVGKTDVFSPLAPEARQAFFDQADAGHLQGSSECNIGDLISFEDVNAITASKPEDIPRIKQILEGLKAKGIISVVPPVYGSGDFDAALRGETPAKPVPGGVEDLLGIGSPPSVAEQLPKAIAIYNVGDTVSFIEPGGGTHTATITGTGETLLDHTKFYKTNWGVVMHSWINKKVTS